MSWWTDFRDGFEALAAVVLNYYYPGSGMITGQLVSKGAQEHLYGNWLGQAAMFGSGFAGGLGGNFANYGSTLDWLSGAGASAGAAGAVGDAGSVLGGASAGGTAGSDLNQMAQAKVLMDQGVPAVEAYQSVGIAPGEMGALSQTGAAPTFTGQDMAGAYGNVSAPTGTPFNAAGTGGAFTGNSLGGGLAAPGAVSATQGAGAMPWGSPGNIANIAQGISGFMSANRMPDRSEQADPFARYRREYGDRLARLNADPSSIQNEPGYAAGLQAVQRTMAAQGYTGSGNMMAAIAKYGGDFYNKTADRYAALAGAGVNPASAAQLGLAQDQYQQNLRRASIGNLGYAGAMAGGWPGR